MGIQQYLTDDDLTAEEIRDALERPSHFAYFGDDAEMFKSWALGPIIETRDSDCIDRCNAEALRRYLATMPELADDWKVTGCSHWAVGHVDHLTYRVVGADGKATRIARIVKAWFHYLREVHPVADEDLLSEMEQQEADQVWKNCYTDEERLKYIRKYRRQFEFQNFADMLGCVRGKYFAGWASELIYR